MEQDIQETGRVSKKRMAIYIAVLLVIVGGIYTASRLASANGDYICTLVVPSNGECTNGSWGSWQTVSSTEDTATCKSTLVESRVYSGTRQVQETITFSGSESTIDCQGGIGSASGRASNVVTQSSACQIQDTRMTVTPITTGACANTGGNGNGNGNESSSTSTQPTVTVSRTQQDVGSVIQNTVNISSREELDRLNASLQKGDISVSPNLVRKGDTTAVSWSSQYMASCTVTGTNGDSWQGIKGQQTSGPIQQLTTYTLSCMGISGKPSVQTAEVRLLPDFREQ